MKISAPRGEVPGERILGNAGGATEMANPFKALEASREVVSESTLPEAAFFMRKVANDTMPAYRVWTPGAIAECRDIVEAMDTADKMGGILFSRCP